MSVPLPCRAPLSDLLTVAAEMARDGDTQRAMEVKGARDALKQHLCDHSEGFQDHLTMGGTVTTCKGCGAPP